MSSDAAHSRPPSRDTLPAAALEDWIARELGATRVTIRRVARLSGGAIQENWSIHVDVGGGAHEGTHDWVLRTNAPASVPTSSTRAQEFRVLDVAWRNGVIVPAPIALCADTSVIGREFFVMARVPGVAAGHELTRDRALVPEPDALVAALGANLARIHAVEPPLASLASLGAPPREPARAAIAQYRGDLDHLDDAYPTLEWGLRWCELHAPGAARIALVHRDYRTGNYLVDNGKLAGVLDWEFAGWGDPREDLGWFSARCWRFAAPEREAGGIAAMKPFLDAYEAAGGAHVTRDELHYWQVMAHLRWAVIALQQAQRHSRGGERSLELALTGRIVHELESGVLHLLEETPEHRVDPA